MITQTIPEQLTQIYFQYENWHKTYMPYKEAVKYHTDRMNSGNITVYLENYKVIAYYERYFNDDVCFLYNVFVMPEYRNGWVFRRIYRQFFDSMPHNITKVFGEKQKINGILVERIISNGRRYGKHKD